MKQPVTHVLWTLAAATAFAGGVYWQKSHAPEAAVTTNLKSSVERSTASSSGGAAPAAKMPASLDGISNFLQRYTNADGSPLTAQQMKAAMGEVLGESDPIKNSLMFATLLDGLSAENAMTVMTELKSKVAGFEGMRYFGLLGYKWGSIDGPAALEEAGKQDGPGRMMSSISSIAGWATKDPAAAEAYLAEHPSENGWEKSGMTRGLVSGLMRSDPAAAEAYVQAMKDTGDRRQMTQVIAEEKLKQGTDAAAAWASSITDPEMKKGAVQSVLDQMLKNDPKKAMSYMMANSGDAATQAAFPNLVRQIASKDPQEGIAFAQSLPAGQARNDSWKSSFREFADKDPTAASTALNSLPKGPDRDYAASGLARAVVREDAQAAIAWASSIADPSVKQESLEEVMPGLFRRDPDAARTYMTQNNWTAEQITKVTTREDRGGPGGGGPPGGGGRGMGGGRFGRGN